jgi:hypothetical protein
MADQSLLVSWKSFVTETGFVIDKEREAYGMMSQNLLDNDIACVLHLGTPNLNLSWHEAIVAGYDHIPCYSACATTHLCFCIVV